MTTPEPRALALADQGARVSLEAALRARLRELAPDAKVLSIEALGPDGGATAVATAGASAKAAGYGLPLKILLQEPDGGRRELVWRVASANAFGHDRRADRAAAMVQAFDDFAQIPHHVRALDLGVIERGGALASTREATEHYLITTYAPGAIYADDLRRIAQERQLTPLDHARLAALIRVLSELHTPLSPPGVRYRRAIRDLVGSGEGIFGIIDGFPEGVPGAGREQLRALEAAAQRWRWRLRDRDDRLCRTHGDFHPFNIVFDGDVPTLLDASRGGCGDPADDLTALAVNFLLFALDMPGAWSGGLGALWHALWRGYLAARPDDALLTVAPPFFLWRALVVANPVFYPRMSAGARERLLGLAAAMLEAGQLAPEAADEVMR